MACALSAVPDSTISKPVKYCCYKFVSPVKIFKDLSIFKWPTCTSIWSHCKENYYTVSVGETFTWFDSSLTSVCAMSHIRVKIKASDL